MLGEQVRRHGVNTLWLTSAYFNLIVDTCPEILAGSRAGDDRRETVLCGARAACAGAYPGLRLVNGYGPSETTVFASCFVVPAGYEAPTLPVGRPVGDRRVYLLDRHLGAVPIGVPGELYVGGTGGGAGVPGAAGADGGAVRPRPVLGAGGGAAVPHGRPGAVACGRGAGVRGADGLPGEGARLPRGAGGGGGRAVGGTRQCARRWWWCGRTCRASGRLVALRRGRGGGELRCGGAARLAGRAAAGVHGAGARSWCWTSLPLTPNGKVDRRALPAPEWGAAEERVRGAADASGGGAGGDLGGGAGGGAGGGGGQLLRPGRALAAGHAGGLARAGGAVRGAAAARRSSRRRRWRGWRSGWRRCGARSSRCCRRCVPVERDGSAAAVLRAAAALVPGPAGAGERRSTTSPRRCGCAGALDAASAGAGAGGDRAAARGAADDVRARRRASPCR